MSKVSELHKTISPKSVGIYIVTCSTSKFNQLKKGESVDDASGGLIEQLIKRAGHQVAGRELISDSVTMIRRTTKRAMASKDVDALIITGGT
ncbi:MAG TPA: molybdopterin-binding protein, partial [Candidatus Acidoferrum sp.]|nr:molybdopterin-binding protein [Candidatus Acidoferrum sp.]